MPETRYFTLNNEPPNGGVPPGTMFAQATNPTPPDIAPVDNGPPNGGAPPNAGALGPPPPAYYPTAMWPAYPMLPAPLAISSPPPPSPSAMVPSHGFSGPVYEPPGQYVDGHMLRGQGWSYIASTEHTTIHFVGNGLRPYEYQNGYYPHQFPFSKHKVPCDMTVGKLIERLGCPPGPHKGVTELILLGDDHFAAGDSYTQGGEIGKKTLGEVGWTAERGEGNPVWLVVKRR